MRYLLLTLLLISGTSAASAQDLDDFVARLSHQDAEARARAACSLARLRSEARPAIPALARLLSDGTDLPPDVCRDIRGNRGWWGNWNEGSSPGIEAARALGEIGLSALESVHSAMRSESATARKNAVRAAGHIEHRSSIDPIANLLGRDPDEDVRAQAAWALGAIEHSDGIRPLTSALGDSAPYVRSQAAWALGAIEHRDAVPALARATRDRSPLVREQAAWALGAIESSDGVDALLPLLEDTDPRVRQQSAWALGAIEDERAVDALLKALDDSDVEVRRMAAWALGTML